MANDNKDYDKALLSSPLYEEYLLQREEIKRHKWIESEKAGRDIGWEKSLLDWKFHHYSAWRKHRIQVREGKH